MTSPQLSHLIPNEAKELPPPHTSGVIAQAASAGQTDQTVRCCGADNDTSRRCSVACHLPNCDER